MKLTLLDYTPGAGFDHSGAIMGPYVNVVNHKAIRSFGVIHADATNPLDRWYRVVRNTADLVTPFTVFDIGGNKYRLIAEINFNRGFIFIRHILTHKQYDKGAWKP